MSGNQYSAPAATRIGEQLGEILAHAIPVEVLGITGKQHQMKRNMGQTVIYRRFLPYGGSLGTAASINTISVDPNLHLTQEGVTPNPDSLLAQDISVTIQQYSCLYMYTDKTKLLHEDDIPQEQITQVGERMGLLREMIRYGTLKGCTNKFYAGGSSRSTVAEGLSVPLLRNITRSLLGNRGKMITRILSASPLYNTSPVEASFLVFCHTDCENDIRELPGFIHRANYGSQKVMHEMEIGSVDRYRFIVSPELAPILDAGATAAGTGLVTSSTLVDVYPVVVVAGDAWGDVALRGASSFDISHQPVGTKDKSDPLGQRGYTGAIFWSACFIQNDGWMAVAEVGVTDLNP
ncbi:MAG: N4-gp56 family major capsid protein [Lysobacterales bacterium]|nr:MAG: N4-gp56 family major capsid protein [Xanthomonadales bacterium]